MAPIALAFLIILLAGILYFNGWIKLSLSLLTTFFAINIRLFQGLMLPEHSIIFWTIIFIFVIWPAFLMILFALDVRYGLFCFDMSYAWVWVWSGAAILFGINVVGSVLQYLLSWA